MSRKQERREKQQEVDRQLGDTSAPPPEPPVQKTKPANVKRHLQCPICFPGLGGTGKEKWWDRINSNLVKRCYACNQCGHKWTVKVRTIIKVESTEHEEVEYDGCDDSEA